MVASVEDGSQATNEPPNETSDKRKQPTKTMASVGETMSFVWACGWKVRLILIIGIFGSILNGMVYPAIAYVISNSFSDLSGAFANGMSAVADLAYKFMIVGAFAFVFSLVQYWGMEIAAYHGSLQFRLEWFRALLRQDSAYFDVYDIAALANHVGSHASKFRYGVGRKLGEGIQYFTTAVCGLIFAFYSDWLVSLVILAIAPVIALAMSVTISLNQNKSARENAFYSRAGGVAYSAISSIRTVLSLNAVTEMVQRYSEATEEALQSAASMLVKIGFSTGSILSTFISLYAVVTLFGVFLITNDVLATGCDPSGSVSDNVTCTNSGVGIFGAMMGIAFAAQNASQFGGFTEAFAAGRVAACVALQAINRKQGAPEHTTFKKTERDYQGNRLLMSHSYSHSHCGDADNGGDDIESGEGSDVKAVLPKYEIDSSSQEGLRPTKIVGDICFKDVHFAYPTRPGTPVLRGLSIDIAPGSVVALVGPSGSGKSSVVSLLERFYDPLSGSIELDGTNIKDINVTHLRSAIGYVGQEPCLFATSIRNNILYGNPNATQEEIEAAAKMANAHDFITSFAEGYDTFVGDKGSQLSGGQKQRVSLACSLVGDPKILLLDEATSALDAESELVVQDALDNILAQRKITTIVVAHRLSTIRNADLIITLRDGRAVEKGTHEELMARNTYYRKLVEKQEGMPDHSGSHHGDEPDQPESRRASLSKILSDENMVPHIEFKDVKFTYPSRPNRPVLDGFSLVIPQSKSLAICGPSGGGKSTTVALIERFYDPAEGVIEYMGHDVKTLNVEWFRSQIGYVSQEPTLFNDTIANNIRFGAQDVSQEQIEEAAKQANAHDFIMQFPEGYDTCVGERGGQLSGGQRQRVSIARALARQPSLLVLDEATSALDNESEAAVQAAIDKLMVSPHHTVIVIAHRLSTIRNADIIAFVADGMVLECGSHEDLMAKTEGRYRRLFDSSRRDSSRASAGLVDPALFCNSQNQADEEVIEVDTIPEEEGKEFVKQARELAKPDSFYIFVGTIGATLVGGVYPTWGVLFSFTVDLLFRRVESCAEGDVPDPSFNTCEDYYEYTVNKMKQDSYIIAVYWASLIAACLLGNVLVKWGMGMASERLNKRVRDISFIALLRQEVAFFDLRSVGSLTSRLQEDAARIHAFTGEPLSTLVVAFTSVVIGVVISFFFMWPLALLSMCLIPLMGASNAITTKDRMGQDLGKLDAADEMNTPGGIVVETLLNIRTVAALTLEKRRYDDYKEALSNSEKKYRLHAFVIGLTSGTAMLIRMWIHGLLFFWGGYLLVHYPTKFNFQDFLIADFALLFSMYGLGAAFNNVSDRKEIEESSRRIFNLLDRESEIDPLSSQGKKLT